MSLLLAPYTNGMRLGQGFNTYTQQICVDNAVVIDPKRAENVVKNDGTTMRILAQKMKKASVWRQMAEYVVDGELSTVNTEPNPNEKPIAAPGNSEGLIEPDTAQPRPDTDAAATKAKLDKENEQTSADLKELAKEAAARAPEGTAQTTGAGSDPSKTEADSKAAAREAVLKGAKDKFSAPVDSKKELEAKTKDRDQKMADRPTGLAPGADKAYAWSMEQSIGTSQVVNFSYRFVDKLSEVSDDMSASAALSIRSDSFGGSGNGAFINVEKFHSSDIRLYLSVKVINQSINFKDALEYNPIRSIKESDTEKFTECFGNAFISGFLEGGELNAVVLIKVLNDVKKKDIMAEAKVALTKGIELDGQGNIALAKKNIELNSEVTINVRYSGGASIKSYDEQWTIDSLLAAANRFPYLVSQFPQRTYAILTKYESLRSFVKLKPAKVSPLKFENAAIYTNQLLDAYLEYSTLAKRVATDIEAVRSGVKRFKIPVPTAQGDDGAKSAPVVLLSRTLQASGLKKFEPSLEGLDLARRQIRIQQNNIVREVDLIERDPNIATQDRSKAADGGPVFVGPASFMTLIPEVEFKVRRVRNQALTTSRTTEEVTAPPKTSSGTTLSNFDAHLFDQTTSTLALSEVEQIKVADLERDNPELAEITRVTPPVGSLTAGTAFCTIDIGLQEPVLSSISVLRKTDKEQRDMTVRALSITYRNGFTIEFGDKIDDYSAEDDEKDPYTELLTLSGLGASEMITSAKIEVDGTGHGDTVSVIGVHFTTNKGSLLDALTSPDRTRMQEHYRLHSFEKPIADAYVSGFWGRARSAHQGGRIDRLGLVWTQAYSKDAIFDDDNPIECMAPRTLLEKTKTGSEATVRYNKILPGLPQFIWGLRDFQSSTPSKPSFRATKKVTTESFAYQLSPHDASNVSPKLNWMVLPELKDVHIQCGEVQLSLRDVDKNQIVPFELPFKSGSTPKVTCWIIDFQADGETLDIKTGPIQSSIKAGSFELKVSDSGAKFDTSTPDRRSVAFKEVTIGWLAHDAVSEQSDTSFLSGNAEVSIGPDGSEPVTVRYASNFSGKPTKHFVALSAIKADLKSAVKFSSEVREATAEHLELAVEAPAKGVFSAVWVSSL